MPAPTIYRSTDGSAPALTGQTGSLTALLKACLVTGYGSKAAAGWSNPFTGAAGQEVFRQGGAGFYWHVDDTGPGLGLQREARTRGYEVTTAWATGTGLFPTAAQAAAGVIVRKSATADGTARAWVVAADDRTVYLFFLTGDAASTYYAMMFGDFASSRAADTYKTAIMGRNLENNATSAVDSFGELTASFAAQGGHYIARSYTGLGAATTADKHAFREGQATPYAWIGPLSFPNPPDGGLYLHRILVTEANIGFRGYLRGVYQPLVAISVFADGDTFDGVGEMAGRSFLALKQSGGPAAGVYIVETTTWDSSV
jgi:hypothetical protein